jgi:hypothetical protein
VVAAVVVADGVVADGVAAWRVVAAACGGVGLVGRGAVVPVVGPGGGVSPARHLNNIVMDIEEGDVERLNKLAQLVEGNCEFLTTIRQGLTQRNDLQRKSLRTLEDYLGQPRDRERKSKLNIDGLLQLLIELAYFLYSCRNFAVTPNIASDDLRVEETFSRSNDRRFSIVLYYRLTEQRMQDSEAALLFNTFFEDILRSLEEYLRAREEFTQNDIENEQMLDLFRRQYRLITQELDFFSNR